MISLNWLPETAYLYILIFARVGSILMLIPQQDGIGSRANHSIPRFGL